MATNVHYKPLPMFTAYKNMGFSIEDYPNAFAQYQNEITLPLHTCLTDADVDYVISCVSNILAEISKKASVRISEEGAQEKIQKKGRNPALKLRRWDELPERNAPGGGKAVLLQPAKKNSQFTGKENIGRCFFCAIACIVSSDLFDACGVDQV